MYMQRVHIARQSEEGALIKKPVTLYQQDVVEHY